MTSDCRVRVLRMAAWCALTVAVVIVPVRAADRVGVYCLLDDVVVEPSAGAPERVQLWGAFIFADNTSADGYGPAAYGYMYYACPAGKAAECKTEWADLLWFSGTGKGVGYGLRSLPADRLRKPADPLQSPDRYPLDSGLVKMESKDPSFSGLVARLKAALGK